MKHLEKLNAIELRKLGYSIKDISQQLRVAKSSVSVWVRDISLTQEQIGKLKGNSYTSQAVEKRRKSRLKSELIKRQLVIDAAKNDISKNTMYELKLMGTMLYWAEGGKTQRMVRFSNGDPKMIKIMMRFFRKVCIVQEQKLRGHIHIHPHLDASKAEDYWSKVTKIPSSQFFKTYQKVNISSKNKKNSLPYGVLDVYVLDTQLFYKIVGWSQEIFRLNP